MGVNCKKNPPSQEETSEASALILREANAECLAATHEMGATMDPRAVLNSELLVCVFLFAERQISTLAATVKPQSAQASFDWKQDSMRSPARIFPLWQIETKVPHDKKEKRKRRRDFKFRINWTGSALLSSDRLDCTTHSNYSQSLYTYSYA